MNSLHVTNITQINEMSRFLWEYTIVYMYCVI